MQKQAEDVDGWMDGWNNHIVFREEKAVLLCDHTREEGKFPPIVLSLSLSLVGGGDHGTRVPIRPSSNAVL